MTNGTGLARVRRAGGDADARHPDKRNLAAGQIRVRLRNWRELRGEGRGGALPGRRPPRLSLLARARGRPALPGPTGSTPHNLIAEALVVSTLLGCPTLLTLCVHLHGRAAPMMLAMFWLLFPTLRAQRVPLARRKPAGVRHGKPRQYGVSGLLAALSSSRGRLVKSQPPRVTDALPVRGYQSPGTAGSPDVPRRKEPQSV